MKLSIITATWNSAKTIASTLDSLSAQTYRDFEFIVVDGASTDDTLEVIKRSKVKVDKLISEPDRGIYDALNKGINAATGDYVGFLHSDDLFASPDSMARLAERLIKTKPDAIYADLEYVGQRDTDKVVRYWNSGKFKRSKLRWGWMPPHPTFYMRRELYQQFGGFDLRYSISADYDSLVRYLWNHSVYPEYLPEVLVKMRVGGASNQSLSNILSKSRQDLSIIRRHDLPVIATFLGKNLSKIVQFFKKDVNYYI